jgi:WhiB family redox-sensing transcriptional regulator
MSDTLETGEQSPVTEYGYWEMVEPLPFPDLYSTWREQSLCKDKGELFFVPTYRGVNVKWLHQRKKRAMKICADCPVQYECLRYAVLNDMRHGIWGGKDMQSLKKEERVVITKRIERIEVKSAKAVNK